MSIHVKYFRKHRSKSKSVWHVLLTHAHRTHKPNLTPFESDPIPIQFEKRQYKMRKGNPKTPCTRIHLECPKIWGGGACLQTPYFKILYDTLICGNEVVVLCTVQTTAIYGIWSVYSSLTVSLLPRIPPLLWGTVTRCLPTTRACTQSTPLCTRPGDGSGMLPWQPQRNTRISILIIWGEASYIVESWWACVLKHCIIIIHV